LEGGSRWENGTLTVDRNELANALERAGLNPDVAMKGRITINAVVRRACAECGLPQVATPELPVHCCCIGGPKGAIENLGVISDSGPRRFLPRTIWRVRNLLKGRV
jgi:hypothetical protein